MPQVLGPILIAITVLLCLVAWFIVLSMLFPQRITRTRQVADAMPGRAFLAGLVNCLFFVALALAFVALAQLTHADALRVPALLVLAVPGICISFGLAGVVQLVGERLAAHHTGLQRTIWGTLALSLACLTPFVGWFGLLPYVGLLGMGAFIIGFFYKDRPAPPTESISRA